MTRDRITTEPFRLISEAVRARVIARIGKLPIDPERPVVVTLGEEAKPRKRTLNDAMWAGPLRDIERDAIHDGRHWDAKIWHEHFKEVFLPDDSELDFEPFHVVKPEAYRKWTTNPWTGARVLSGSTTQLTDKGMRVYLEKIEAHAATEYGVTFTTRDEPMGWVR
jgi:hypothetical protein